MSLSSGVHKPVQQGIIHLLKNSAPRFQFHEFGIWRGGGSFPHRLYCRRHIKGKRNLHCSLYAAHLLLCDPSAVVTETLDCNRRDLLTERDALAVCAADGDVRR